MSILRNICDMMGSPRIWIPIWRGGQSDTSQISLWRMLILMFQIIVRILTDFDTHWDWLSSGIGSGQDIP